MAGRPPVPFYYTPGSSILGSSGQPPPPPPPPPPPSSHPVQQPFAYSYSYSSYNASMPTAPPSYNQSQQICPPVPSNPAGQQANVATSKPTPATSAWNCDTCSVSLDSEKAWKSHRKSHVKCTECDFEGAPKVVKGHYQGVHGRFSGSGYKSVAIAVPGCRVQRFKICVGNRPEDIQRWIADRKKRFPRQKQPEAPPTAKDTQHDIASSNNKTKEGEKIGLSSLLAGYGSSSGSDEENFHQKEKVKDVQPKEEMKDEAPPKADAEPDEVSNSAAPLVEVSYNAAEPVEKSNTSKTKQFARPCRYFARNGSCLNGDACRFSHEVRSKRFPDQAQNGNCKRKRGKTTSSDTLLRKLLANDMERESTLSMQLLGYIVESNFFNEKSEPATDNSQLGAGV